MLITDSSWDFTSLCGSSLFSLSLSESASRVTEGMADMVFGRGLPGCGERMLIFGRNFTLHLLDASSLVFTFAARNVTGKLCDPRNFPRLQTEIFVLGAV
jgi:hypothetical protein